MPAHRDSSKSHSSSGGSSGCANGTSTRQRETELKRLRGDISCAECRRLKLKCDKKVPCSSCTRRGCQTICPLGELLGGQGGRLVLADTDELHRTIAEMSKRIRQLEDALQIEHGMHSSEFHPLLSEELLTIKKALDRNKNKPPEEAEAEDGEAGEDVLCAMGLLTISEGGGARYLGATGSEQALLAEVGVTETTGTMLPDATDAAEKDIPQQLVQASHLWPFRAAFGSTMELHELLEAQLPSRERASGLSESFLLNMSWFSRPVTREQIMEELIPAAYKQIPDSHRGARTRLDLHDLALLYMVFAAGAAADLTLPPYNAEAEKYRHLARSALGLKSVFEGSSMSAVQTICLMGTYDVASGRKHSMESAWKMACLAFSLSASIGLHRDPARWHLDPKIIHRRRLLFWEMCWIDNWKSLATGRPTSFTPDVIDCEFPEDHDAVKLKDGTVVPSLWAIKNQFSKKILSVVAVRLCAARPPKYSEILQMDRLVREFDMQPVELVDTSQLQIADEEAAFVRQSALRMFRDLVLLYIHRNYFARALLDHAGNPLRSPFAPSFLAAYRSATSLLRNLRRKYALFPHVFLRHWPTWAHALAASVVVGSVVTRSPSLSLAPAAFIELEQSISLFESASAHPIVRQGVPILTRMYERAKAALEKAKAAGTVSGLAPEEVERLVNSIGEGVKEEDCEDMLKILAGSTRTTHQKSPPPESGSGSTTQAHYCPYSATTSPPNGSGSDSEQSMFHGLEHRSVSKGPLTVMPESAAEMPALLGLTRGDTMEAPQTPQASSGTWPSVLSAGDYGDQIMQDILGMELPGWHNHLRQDLSDPSVPNQQQHSNSNPMNAANTANGRSETPYFPFGGIDFSNLEHLNLISGFPSTTAPSTSASHGLRFGPDSSAAPQVNDSGIFSMQPVHQHSDHTQNSTSLLDLNSSLPLVDGDIGPNERMGDLWQSFVSDSGFQTADELMRSWQIY